MTSLVAFALAGYGDPVDGHPSREERLLHLWTNAARVAPEEFEADYNNGYTPCSFYENFSEDEQTPKAPVYIDVDLNEVARFHSVDMNTNGCFQHNSCDGTDTWARVAQYYDDTGNLGENIAMGVTDMRYAVMGMWMCSEDGHRANIMSGEWNELGTGVDSEYQTQDFAAGILEMGAPPVRMAVDDGETFYADWGDPAAPTELSVVIDGVDHPLELLHGADEQGIYTVDVAGVDSEPCRTWYVWWRTAAGATGTFPEEGSWLVGTDCKGMAGADGDWLAQQTPRGGLFGDDPTGAEMLEDLRLTGCAVAPGSPVTALAGLFASLLVLRRRR